MNVTRFPWDRFFFNAPLVFLHEHENLLDQYPVNPEIYVDGIDLQDLDAKLVKRTRKLLDGRNLRRRVHGPISEMIAGAFDPWVREVTRKRFSQAIDFAGGIGAEAIVIHSGYDPLNKRNLERDYLKNLVATLRALCARASGAGARVLLENTFELSPELLLDAVSEVGQENIGLCFDVAHHHVFAKASLGIWLERCAPHIEEIHITDNDGGWDDHLAPGRGRIDFGGFFDLLKTNRIDAVFTFEPNSIEQFTETLAFIELHPDYFGEVERGNKN
jgi:sugar phosphate isomerase/epimerase